MIDPSLFAAFLVASVVVLAIPGPTILLVVTRSLNHGPAARRATVAGVVLGDLVAMTTAMIGLGAVLQASAQLFTALRLIGGLYLVWLGIGLIRSRGAGWTVAAADGGSARRVFCESFAVTATNPKSIAFFVAFVPQFLDPALPLAPQTVAMILAFVALGGLNAAAYAWMAARVRHRLVDARIRRRIAAVSGGALVAGGSAVIGTV